jgi:hypothetical protein
MRKSGMRKGRRTKRITGVQNEETMRKSGMRKGRRTHPPTGDQSWNAVELSVGDRRACVKQFIILSFLTLIIVPFHKNFFQAICAYKIFRL